MGHAVVVRAGEGEVVGDAPDRRVEILSEVGALHATFTRFGPGRPGADLHIHRRHTDLFYVLEGEMTARLGTDGREVAVPAGTLVRLPPLVVHGFDNRADADLRYLNLHAPGQGFADYLRGLRDGRPVAFDQDDPPVDGGLPVGEAAVGGELHVADRPGVRVALLADVEEIAVAEVVAAPGARMAPHVHDRRVASLYVLDGEVSVSAGDAVLRAPAGAWVQVPAGVAHVVSSGTGARFLEIHTPGGGFGAVAARG